MASLKTDVKFVACDVCKRAMSQLYQLSDGRDEEAILEATSM